MPAACPSPKRDGGRSIQMENLLFPACRVVGNRHRGTRGTQSALIEGDTVPVIEEDIAAPGMPPHETDLLRLLVSGRSEIPGAVLVSSVVVSSQI